MVTQLNAFGDIQVPLLAAMLFFGGTAKLVRVAHGKSVDAGLGPIALFSVRLRSWAAAGLGVLEISFGAGLVLTSGQFGKGPPAEFVRIGTCLLFVVATCALIELRSVRPDLGCGCFGGLSSSPITRQTVTRSGLLALAALITVPLPPIQLPQTLRGAALLLLACGGELAIFGYLSPEFRDLLVRIGYSAPCELRLLSTEQTLAALQRTTQWRRHSGLITDHQPSDIWRELCWRYIAFPSRCADKDAELVFAIHLQHRRPAVLSALVDATTGAVLPWPEPARKARSRWPLPLTRHRPVRLPSTAGDLPG